MALAEVIGGGEGGGGAPFGKNLKFSICRQRPVFNCTIKLHAVWHIGYNSKWENPRSSWCWMGEDFMKVSRTLLFSGSKGVKLERVHHKALMKLIRAMEWQFKQCE